jgi:hypothetical protein
MLTVFSTPKPFHGHAGLIQRNAIRSWTLLSPKCEVILFGDEQGAAEIAREFHFRNEREVERSETGTKYVRFLFERAQRLASNDILCYCNCDIILMSSFWRAVEQVASLSRPFLMVGRRMNIDITEPLNLEQSGWEQRLEQLAREKGHLANEWCADYFVFSRGLYKDIPPLVNGRNYWDNWLIWRAYSLKAIVVDATRVVTAVHQNHDYGYHPGGATGVMDDLQTRRNLAIGKNGWRLRTINEATHRLTADGIARNWVQPANLTVRISRWYWLKMLNLTRPIRHRLGLHQRTMRKIKNGVQRLVPGHRAPEPPAE